MITLKSIKIFDKMHDDSNAFHASILWQGKKVGTCSDNGQAGIIDFDVPSDILDQMYKYAAAQPQVECQGYKLDMSLDLLVGKIVENHMREKNNAKNEKRTQKWIAKNKAYYASHGCEIIILNHGSAMSCLPFKSSVASADKAVAEWKTKNPKENVTKWEVV